MGSKARICFLLGREWAGNSLKELVCELGTRDLNKIDGEEGKAFVDRE